MYCKILKWTKQVVCEFIKSANNIHPRMLEAAHIVNKSKLRVISRFDGYAWLNRAQLALLSSF